MAIYDIRSGFDDIRSAVAHSPTMGCSFLLFWWLWEGLLGKAGWGAKDKRKNTARHRRAVLYFYPNFYRYDLG